MSLAIQALKFFDMTSNNSLISENQTNYILTFVLHVLLFLALSYLHSLLNLIKHLKLIIAPIFYVYYVFIFIISTTDCENLKETVQKVTNMYFKLYVTKMQDLYPNMSEIQGVTSINQVSQGLASVLALLQRNPGHWTVLILSIAIGLTLITVAAIL